MEVWNGYVTFRGSHSWKATQEGLVPFLYAMFICLSRPLHCFVELLRPIGKKWKLSIRDLRKQKEDFAK